MIYLDNNATTRIAPEVLDAMLPFLADSFGNPSSAHALGRGSKKAVDAARDSVAALLGAEREEEIAFTSSGTESDNWAILGGLASRSGKHLIISAVEHEAVRNLATRLENDGISVTRLGVGEDGSLDLDELSAALTAKTAVVSVMHANNETGVLFPVEKIAETVKACSSALVHVDGVNAAGKVAIDLKNTAIDLYSVSAHKFHGPKGIGALYIRSGVEIGPMFTGGGQEFGRRAGTEAVHQIAGIGAAARIAADLAPMGRVCELRDHLESAIMAAVPAVRVNGASAASGRLPNTSNLSFENANGEMIMARLDDLGIAVSTGSACASGRHTASAVLQAMNVPYSFTMGSIRFSLGRYSTPADVDAAAECLPQIVSEIRRLAGR
jgi:cysteine desulfurase